MAGTPLPAPRTHLSFTCVKAAAPQPVGEGATGTGGGPDGQHAPGFQGSAGGEQSVAVVEALIAADQRRIGPVVDVEQDRVVAIPCFEDHVGDVAQQHRATAVRERVSRDLAERAAVPLDDGRHQLGHIDPTTRPDLPQGGRQGETHAQTADQHSRLLALSNPLAAQLGQSVLRGMLPAVHQLAAVDGDREFATAASQSQNLAAAGHSHRVQCFPRNHPARVHFVTGGCNRRDLA